MSRSLVSVDVRNRLGGVVSGVEVTLYDEDGEDLISQTLYVAASGGTTTANPLVTDENGQAQAFVDNPQRMVAVTGGVSRIIDVLEDPEDGGGGGSTDGDAFLQYDPYINGAMQVWNGSTSQASVTDAACGPEMWFYRKPAGAAVLTMARSTDVPLATSTTPQLKYSTRFTVTTADASVAATDAVWFEHRMEGFDWQLLQGRQFTLPYGVRMSVAGVYCVALSNGVDRSCVLEYTITTPDVWQIVSVTVPASPSGGTWDTGNGTGLYTRFVMQAGTNYQTASIGAWNSDTKIATANQTNALGTISNVCGFALVGKPATGTAAIPSVSRTYPETLAACKRYFQKSSSDGTLPLAATFEGAILFQVSDNNNNKVISLPIKFPVEMRGVPVVSVVDLNGSSNKITTYAADGSFTNGVTPSSGVNNAGSTGFVYSQTAGIAGFAFGWQASARLA